MKIKYLNNNAIDHVERNLAQSLIRAGLAVSLEPEIPTQGVPGWKRDLPKPGDAKIAPPKWAVETIHLGTTAVLVVVCEVGGQRHIYSGDPARINERKTWPGGGRWLSGLTRECPKEIVREYARQYVAPGPQPMNSETAVAFSSGGNETMASELAARNRGRS